MSTFFLRNKCQKLNSEKSKKKAKKKVKKKA